MGSLKQAILFSRVSSKKQNNESKFEETLKLAKEYCEGGGTNKSKEKFCLFEKHYKHVGTAFNKDIRDGEEMREIVGKIEDGTFQKPVILLFANGDRLDRRDIDDSVPDLMNLGKKGIIFHELKSGTVLDIFTKGKGEGSEKMFNIMYFMMVMYRAWEESQSKSVRAKNGYNSKKRLALQKFDKGEKFILGGSLPKWIEKYDEKKSEFVLRPNQVKQLKYIFKRLIAGVSAYALVKELNHLAKTDSSFQNTNFLNSSVRHSIWTSSAIKNCYSNKALIGTKQFGKGNINKADRVYAEIPNYYPAIISEEDFYKVQILLQSRKHSGRTPYLKSIFSHLCKCYYCENVNGRPSNCIRRRDNRNIDAGYFFTCNGENYIPNSCNMTRTLESELQSVFLRYLREVNLVTLLKAESGTKLKSIDKEIQKLEIEKLELSKRKQNIASAIEIGGNIKELVDQLKTLQTKFDKLDKTISDLELEKLGLSDFSISINDKKELAQSRIDPEDESKILKLNLALRRIVQSIELAPHGLPRLKPLDKFNGMGSKVNLPLMYGKKFPAFKINFKNGVSRTIIFQRRKVENVLSIYKEEDQLIIDHEFSGDLATLVVGSKEFAELKLGKLKPVDEFANSYMQSKTSDFQGVEFKSRLPDSMANSLIENVILHWQNPAMQENLENAHGIYMKTFK